MALRGKRWRVGTSGWMGRRFSPGLAKWSGPDSTGDFSVERTYTD
ncbi:MAG: hypothetical protein P8I97_13615 [Verrucomicrobiales bacterium]|nr:hypothetical protein [Verrucomicrobiales bacterium]